MFHYAYRTGMLPRCLSAYGFAGEECHNCRMRLLTACTAFAFRFRRFDLNPRNPRRQITVEPLRRRGAAVDPTGMKPGADRRAAERRDTFAGGHPDLHRFFRSRPNLVSWITCLTLTTHHSLKALYIGRPAQILQAPARRSLRKIAKRRPFPCGTLGCRRRCSARHRGRLR